MQVVNIVRLDGDGLAGAHRPFRRVDKPRKTIPGVVAVTLRAQARIRVTFRIGVPCQRHRTVARGTRRVTFPIPRCGSCTVMKVRIVASGTTYDTFRIAALAADPPERPPLAGRAARRGALEPDAETSPVPWVSTEAREIDGGRPYDAVVTSEAAGMAIPPPSRKGPSPSAT